MENNPTQTQFYICEDCQDSASYGQIDLTKPTCYNVAARSAGTGAVVAAVCDKAEVSHACVTSSALHILRITTPALPAPQLRAVRGHQQLPQHRDQARLSHHVLRGADAAAVDSHHLLLHAHRAGAQPPQQSRQRRYAALQLPAHAVSLCRL